MGVRGPGEREAAFGLCEHPVEWETKEGAEVI